MNLYVSTLTAALFATVPWPRRRRAAPRADTPADRVVGRGLGHQHRRRGDRFERKPRSGPEKGRLRRPRGRQDPGPLEFPRRRRRRPRDPRSRPGAGRGASPSRAWHPDADGLEAAGPNRRLRRQPPPQPLEPERRPRGPRRVPPPRRRPERGGDDRHVRQDPQGARPVHAGRRGPVPRHPADQDGVDDGIHSALRAEPVLPGDRPAMWPPPRRTARRISPWPSGRCSCSPSTRRTWPRGRSTR